MSSLNPKSYGVNRALKRYSKITFIPPTFDADEEYYH